MRTVVTGAAGFIGSHLCEKLIDDGHHVVAVDSLRSGRLRHLDAVARHPRFRFERADVREPRSLESAFGRADWVFHLAGIADIVPSIDDPADYFATNVAGTLNVLQAARTAGATRFVYAASSSSYGLAQMVPTPETAPIAAEYPYALTKHMGEELVLHWDRTYDLPALSLRLFNVYGPRSRTHGTYGAVFGVFLAQKLHGRPFTVVGDGTQRRDFTHVRDVVDAFVRAAVSPHRQRAINVGSSRPISVNRLVELLGGPVVHVPKRPGEPDVTHADTGLARRLLGWSPRISFEAGVEELLEHLEDWREAPVWDATSIADATRTWFQHLGRQAG
ncbi:MAG: NAD-dependent epimerase/dehydratase family protein [Proteobacteria bacterium]|nr:NAD-dependent epimerase/dehydratase family protein [Pseudomonadota bacterium]